MNPAFVNNEVMSATSDSSIYVTGIVNQSVTCILQHTCATASVLNEGTLGIICIKTEVSNWDADYSKQK